MPWMLAEIDAAGYNGIRDEHIELVANELLGEEYEIDRYAFERACRKCGIDPNNFAQSDLEKLEEKLNEML